MVKEMQIIGEKVIHLAWGEGTIVALNDSRLTVKFASEERSFRYPKIFSTYLRFEDDELQKLIQAMILDAENEENKRLAEKTVSVLSTQTISLHRHKKQPECLNIAFKCNYCDGGKENGIGFNGVCSEFMIQYNVGIAHHSWCSSEECACFQHFNGQVSRRELENEMKYQDGICYESLMLERWRADAGFHLNGEKKNEPRKLKNIQLNSLAILTTRLPFSQESERFIFGVFLVDDGFSGDNRNAGFVTTNSKFRMYLPLDKAKTLRYWKYYKNPKHPETIAWGQGLYRYLTDEQAAAILRDFSRLKHGTKEEPLAKEFLDYFCKSKKIRLDSIPIKPGAL